MVDQKVISYIRQQRGLGFSDDSIKKALVSSGYAKTIINESFRTLESSMPSPPGSSSDGLEMPVEYTVKTAFIPFNPRASRLEVLVRIIWCPFIMIVMWVYMIIAGIISALYGIVAMIAYFVNVLSCLILGKRLRTSFNWTQKWIMTMMRWMLRPVNFMMKRYPYMFYMTDQRPKLGMEPEPQFEKGGSTE